MMGIRQRWAAGLVAMIATPVALGYAACANLPDVPLSMCGNGIVEQPNNEDCDTLRVGLDGGVDDAGNACVACRVVCTDAGVCPWGWGCGTDSICRRPTGTFAQQKAVQINENVESLLLGDLDGTGRKAIIVDTGAALDVHYIDDRGTVSKTTSIAAPKSKPAVGDYDGDGIDDLSYRLETAVTVRKGALDQSLAAVPFPLGLQNQGLTADQRLIAIDARSILVKDFQLKELLRLTPTTVTTFFPDMAMQATPLVLAGVGWSSLPGGPGAAVPPPSASAVPVGYWNETSACQQFVLVNKPMGQIEVHYACQSTGKWNIKDVKSPINIPVTLAAGVSLVGPVFGLDIDGDHHKDLLVYAAGAKGANAQLQVAYGDGKGGFGSTPVMMGSSLDGVAGPYLCLESATIDPLRPVFNECRLLPPLALGDFNGDHVIDLVNACGIFTTSFPSPKMGCMNATLAPAVRSDTGLAGTKWTRARVTDLNGDLAPDVVAGSCDAASMTYLENASPAGSGGPAFFNPYTIPTLGGIDELVTGDFDGDLVLDMAYVERGGSSPVCPDPMSPTPSDAASLGVVFGAFSGGPSRPVVLGQLGAIDQVVASNLTSTIGTFNPIADLAVVSRPTMVDPSDPTRRLLHIFAGSTDREILAPYFLIARDTVKTNADLAPNLPWLSTMGHFDPQATTTMSLAMLTEERLPKADVMSSEARLWVFGQDSDHSLRSLTNSVPVTMTSIGTHELPTSSYVKNSWAWLSALDLGGPPGDEVVVLSRDTTTSKLVVFAQQGGSWAIPEPAPIDLKALYTGPIVVGDIDGDGNKDVVLVGPDVLVLWNQKNGALDPVAGATRLLSADFEQACHAGPDKLVGAAVVRAVPAKPAQIVVLSENHAYLAILEPASQAKPPAFSVSCLDAWLIPPPPPPPPGPKPPKPPPTPPPFKGAHIAAGDVDGDGVDDLVIGTPGSVQLFRGVPIVQ